MRKRGTPLTKGPKVTPIELDARPIVCLETEIDWQDALTGRLKLPSTAIVRAQPPPGTSPTEVEEFRAKVEPKVQVLRILPVARSKAKTKAVKEIKSKTIREVVTDMVETMTTRNRDSLRSYAQQVMGKVGL